MTAGQIITADDIAAGKLVYKSTPGACNAATASFTVQVHDDGGTANGGVDIDQSPNTLTFSVASNQSDLNASDHIASSLIAGTALGPQNIGVVGQDNGGHIIALDPSDLLSVPFLIAHPLAVFDLIAVGPSVVGMTAFSDAGFDGGMMMAAMQDHSSLVHLAGLSETYAVL